jgi:hypothetical protein
MTANSNTRERKFLVWLGQLPGAFFHESQDFGLISLNEKERRIGLCQSKLFFIT